MKERFTYIDSLRGFAIAGVIITHAASIVGISGLLRRVTDVFGLGVQLFFVISAFTIFYTLSRSEGRENQIRDFFIRRFFRIIPVYWFGIIIYTLVYGMGSRGWREGPELWHYPFHIFLVNVLHPLTSSSVVPGGWSISCEILFYLCVPLLYYYINTNIRLAIFVVITVFLLPVANSVLSHILNPVLFANVDPKTQQQFWYRWLPNQLGAFSFGMLLFRIIKTHSLSFLSNRVTNVAGIAITLIAMGGLVVIKPIVIQKHLAYSFLFMVLALLLSAIPWKIFVNRATVFLGQISYSSYLIHFLVINQCFIFISAHFPSLAANHLKLFIVLTLLGFAFTIPLAYLSYKLIEQNAIKWGRKYITYLNERTLKLEKVSS
ncbi:acyltransferase family protein [Spirosoma sp. HMF4905]|uniref:Acyltransferase family protein n=1 Tax=Spirosoma arboris TaxID=2682092 RepID=A0A7K1SKP7_9BACT|nr:acyltransferase [Spirosoma arboris]MVM34370.1 acyltransferase family protein [Spirosoma arboris]